MNLPACKVNTHTHTHIYIHTLLRVTPCTLACIEGGAQAFQDPRARNRRSDGLVNKLAGPRRCKRSEKTLMQWRKLGEESSCWREQRRKHVNHATKLLG